MSTLYTNHLFLLKYNIRQFVVCLNCTVKLNFLNLRCDEIVFKIENRGSDYEMLTRIGEIFYIDVLVS